MTAVKKCSKCGIDKPRVEYHVRRASKDGLAPICRPCAIAKAGAWYADNLDRKRKYDKCYQLRPNVKAVQLAYRERTRSEAIARVAKWKAANPERRKAISLAYYAANKAEFSRKLRAWKKANPGKVNACTARRRATKHSATPPWLPLGACSAIYETARAQGKHVDHIVPLRSKIVCGLHVPWNLQILPGPDNRIKSNKCWPDMP